MCVVFDSDVEDKIGIWEDLNKSITYNFHEVDKKKFMDAVLLRRKHEVEKEIKQILLDFYFETEKVFVLEGVAKRHYGKITPEFGNDVVQLSTSVDVKIHILE